MTKTSRLLSVGMLLVAGWAAAAEPIVLAVGEHKTLNLGTLKKVSTGDPRIAEVTMEGSVVTVTGVGNGRSLLIVWTPEGKRTDYPLVVGTPPAEPTPSAVGAVRFGGTRLEKAQCDAAKGAAAAAACKPGAGADLEKVTAACQAAVAKEPNQASGHKLLASLLGKQKKVADAAREYETYLLSCPDAADAGMVRKILDELAAAGGH